MVGNIKNLLTPMNGSNWIYDNVRTSQGFEWESIKHVPNITSPTSH